MTRSRYGVEPKRKDESSEEFVARCRAYIAQTLAKMAEPKQGPQREWARRILDRYADGEQLPDVSIRFACEALGMDEAKVRKTRRGAA